MTGRERMREMLVHAAELPVGPRGRRSWKLVTEHAGDVCVQCEGRPTHRNTLDGMQPTISFHWFIDCKRSSKAKALAALEAAATKENP